MNNDSVVNMRKILADYISNTTAQKMAAELDTPARRILMAIPDQNFVCYSKQLLDIPASVSFLGSFSDLPLDEEEWREDFVDAANQSLALAA